MRHTYKNLVPNATGDISHFGFPVFHRREKFSGKVIYSVRCELSQFQKVSHCLSCVIWALSKFCMHFNCVLNGGKFTIALCNIFALFSHCYLERNAFSYPHAVKTLVSYISHPSKCKLECRRIAFECLLLFCKVARGIATFFRKVFKQRGVCEF